MVLSSSYLLIMLAFRLLFLSLFTNIIKYVEILLEAKHIILIFGLFGYFKADFVHNLLNLGLMSL